MNICSNIWPITESVESAAVRTNKH